MLEKVITHYHENHKQIELSQVEGFIRQIVGWREYMRGIYCSQMPEYRSKKTLDNNFLLLEFYCTDNSKMNCLYHSVKNSLDHAYAHHIQRLMILGNFAILAQVYTD